MAEPLARLLVKSYGTAAAEKFLQSCHGAAPVFLRANPTRTTPEKLVEQLLRKIASTAEGSRRNEQKQSRGRYPVLYFPLSCHGSSGTPGREGKSATHQALGFCQRIDICRLFARHLGFAGSVYRQDPVCVGNKGAVKKTDFTEKQ